MKEPAIRVHRKRGSFLLMKWTETDKVAPGALEAYVRPDHFDDVGALTDFLDLIFTESSHHSLSTSRSRAG
jgi:hypothetical protein